MNAREWEALPGSETLTSKHVCYKLWKKATFINTINEDSAFLHLNIFYSAGS